jgi:hypothetical protein
VGELRDRIIRLRNEAEYLRGLLDVPPGVRLGSDAVLLERIYALRTFEGGKPYVSDEEYEHRAEPNDSYHKPRLCC